MRMFVIIDAFKISLQRWDSVGQKQIIQIGVRDIKVGSNYSWFPLQSLERNRDK